MKKLAQIILISQLVMGNTWAAQSFVVKNIQVQGLHNINPATVESYLPVKRGTSVSPNKYGDIIRSLYKTGFFEHISLAKEGNTLIVRVVERPTIGVLKIKGNSIIQTDRLTTVMKSLEVAEGRVYNAAVLERIKQSLLNQYYQLGYYNARVDMNTTPMSRNRVAVNVDISEGLAAKIRKINIIGNHAFTEKQLTDQLDLSSRGILSFFTHSDQYSETKLDESAEKLRNFYMDHGYLKAEVKSSQAQISPDRKTVYITYVVKEGEPYTIADYSVNGNLVVPKEEIVKRISLVRGSRFSRQQVLDSEKAINDYFGSQGYLFSTISVRPQVNDKERKVIIDFIVNSGQRTYVRHITFTDNTKTNDVTLRREMVQLEGAPASTKKLEQSKHRLSLLPYLKGVDMSVTPVPQVSDQVDVNYKVTENSSAKASFQLGYSQEYKLMVGIGLNQDNFLGTGNSLGINLNRSRYNSLYAFDYTNPYYTPEGISRSFSLSYSRNDPIGSTAEAPYLTHDYNAGVLYTIPLGQEPDAINRVIAGLSYQNTAVRLLSLRVQGTNTTATPKQLVDFTNRHGKHFQELDFKAGFSHNTLDRAVFPTAGNIQSITVDAFAPVNKDSLAYYQLFYSGKWYHPIYKDQWVALARLNLGYGNGFHGIKDYPFFKNYYAGGIDSVRGFSGSTLGPLDSLGNPYGGNILTTGSLGLVFPNMISENMRTSVFVDAGNVYTQTNNRQFGGQSTDSGPLHVSYGLELDILSPFGPIELAVARGIRRPGDHSNLQFFQFALGANF